MAHGGQRVTLDLFPRGLTPGEGVCGSATALPFRDGAFEVVAAFDVVEHCADEALALAELVRVLAPGGRLLLSVPAYQWAWSDHDVRAGHHRRYTRPRLVAAVERRRAAGGTVDVRLRRGVPDVRRGAARTPAPPGRRPAGGRGPDAGLRRGRTGC